MKRLNLWAVIFTALMLSLSGCGGGGGGSSSPGTNGGTGGNAAGKAPAAAAVSIVDTFIGEGLAGTLAGMSSQGQGLPLAAAREARAEPVTVRCQSGGSLTISANQSTSTIVFNQCTTDGSTVNGTMKISNTTYAHNEFSGTFELQHMTVTEGTLSTYLDLKYTISYEMGSGGSGLSNYLIKISGDVEVTKGNEVSRSHIDNLTVKMAEDKMWLDGKFTIENDPNVCEMNGTYTIRTIQPLTIDKTTHTVTGGEIKINDSTVRFNADGTVTVDGHTYTLSELQEQCGS